MFKYFTSWVVAITLLSLTQNVNVNLPLLSTYVLVVGSYMSFVNPRYYRVSGKLITGWTRFWGVDVLLHLCPLLVNVYRWGLPKDFVSSLHSLAVLLLYLLITPPIYDIYGVSTSELAVPSLVAVVTYVLSTS